MPVQRNQLKNLTHVISISILLFDTRQLTSTRVRNHRGPQEMVFEVELHTALRCLLPDPMISHIEARMGRKRVDILIDEEDDTAWGVFDLRADILDKTALDEAVAQGKQYSKGHGDCPMLVVNFVLKDHAELKYFSPSIDGTVSILHVYHNQDLTEYEIKWAEGTQTVRISKR